MSESVARRRPMIDLEEFERRLRQPSTQHNKDGRALSELARLSDVEEDPYKAVFDPPPREQPQNPYQDQHYDPPLDRGWEPMAPNVMPNVDPNVGPGPAPRKSGRVDFAAIQAGLLGSLDPGVQVPPEMARGSQAYAPHAYADLGQRGAAAQPASYDARHGGSQGAGMVAGQAAQTYANYGYDQNAGNDYTAAAYQRVYPQAEGNANLWPYDEVGDPSGSAEATYSGHSFDEPRSRRPLYIVAGIIVAGLVGIGASLTMRGGKVTDPENVATIMADSGPMKVQPPAPAGGETVTQDSSLLEKAAPTTPPALTGHQERPIDLSQAPIRDARSEPLAAADTVAAASVPVPAAPPLPQSAGVEKPQQTHELAPQQSQSIASLIEPKKVKTISVRPDGTLVQNETPSQPAASAMPVPKPVASPAKAVATPKSTARVTSKDPVAEAIRGVGTTTAAGATAKAQPVQHASATPEAAGAAGGNFVVQFAAPTSEKEARDIQIKLGHQYGAALAGHHTSIHKAVSGERTVYRVRVVGLSHESATSLCQSVQGAGGNCFVAKN
ncbi:SPOR domain-containing protein [Beijerinckia mobilis]|uniref:SPOR domain-containing protein n=1 Tax=Beijerinckia mobilis TaxID=231434 RepID=UPI0005539FC0|nr:SPOR domain-containing protein [Beijerinckia mobilis]